MSDIHPAKSQPYEPPAPAAAVWAIPVEADMIDSLASYFYAQVTWGREPHPSQVSAAEYEHWKGVSEVWKKATLNFLTMLDRVGHVALDPPPRPSQDAGE